MTDLSMTTTKTTVRRKTSRGKKKSYILKRRLASPKSVRFENTQFTVSIRELEQRVKEIDDHAKNKKQVPLFQRKD